MYFHPELGPAPKVGLEVEVVQWTNGRLNTNVAQDLAAESLMPMDTYFDGTHEYKCTCSTCTNIGLDSGFPVLWKMQRDASLPSSGAEFISSPFPTDAFFVQNAMIGVEIISREAVWTLELYNERSDGNASPGLHVHCYAAGPQITGMTTDDLTEAVRTYYAFIPELFSLAASAGVSRGLEYRLPTVQATNHHAFLALAGIGRMRRNDMTTRLEWRLFEIPYNDLDYVEAVIYLCAAMTQLIVRRSVFSQFGAIGQLLPWNTERSNTLEQLVNQFNQERFDVLRDAVLTGTALRDDVEANAKVAAFMGRVG